MSPFGRKKVSKVAKEALKEFPKLYGLYERGEFAKAYNKALEIYNKLTSFSEEEIKKSKEAVNAVTYYLFLLSMTACHMGNFGECVEWGNKFFDMMRHVQVMKGVSEDKIEKMVMAYTESWTMCHYLGVAYCALGEYEKAVNTLTKTVGTSLRITIPEDVFKAFRGITRNIFIFVSKIQLARFLTFSHMLGLLPEEKKNSLMQATLPPEYEAVKVAYDILKDKEASSKVLSKYEEFGLPKEAFDSDKSAVEYLAKLFKEAGYNF